MNQRGFFTDTNDPGLGGFIEDRRRLLIKYSIALAVTALVMIYFGDWRGPLLVTLLECIVWREFVQLRDRVSSGRFGDGAMDHELLEQYFAASGTKIQGMHFS